MSIGAVMQQRHENERPAQRLAIKDSIGTIFLRDADQKKTAAAGIRGSSSVAPPTVAMNYSIGEIFFAFRDVRPVIARRQWCTRWGMLHLCRDRGTGQG
jgi:hypothetical protein